MLIDYKLLVDKYGWSPKGIIHIGANVAEEQPYYDRMGVKNTVWIEALHESVDEMREKFKDRKDVKVIMAVVSDKTEFVTMHVTNNFASSSILPLGTHLKNHPRVWETETRDCWSDTLERIFAVRMLDRSLYDCINVDLQGAELKALKGAGKMLQNIDSIYAEVNTEEVYQGCDLLPELEEYLAGFGFKRKELQMAELVRGGKKVCPGWGDAYFDKA